MTLIELLVVISIMMLLAIVAIPTMRPALETRRIREAARSINVYLGSARNRAVETGRPVGVEIARDPNLVLAGTTLYQVEVPPPYAGDTDSTGVTVTLLSLSGGVATLQAALGSGSFSGGLVRLGDRVQFNHQGWIYTITGANVDVNGVSQGLDANNYVRSSPPAGSDPDGFPLTLQASVPASFAMPTLTAVPFEILRQPTRTSTAPLQLPRDAVIDFVWSGTGGTPLTFSTVDNADANPVSILFSPSGRVYGVRGTLMPGFPAFTSVLDPIYLLVGRRDRVSTDAAATPQQPAHEDQKFNFEDLSTLWVTVNSQTGYVTCAEMASGAGVFAARAYAQQMHSMGGR